MRKMYVLLLIILIFPLFACNDDQGYGAENVAEDHMGTAALMVRRTVGANEFCFLRSDFDAIKTTMITDFENFTDERVFFYLEFEKGDDVGYAVISLNFSYQTDEVSPKPTSTDWKVTVFYDLDEFNNYKISATQSLDTYQSQSETLAQALEDDGVTVEFILSRVSGEYDMRQIYDFVDEEMPS